MCLKDLLEPVFFQLLLTLDQIFAKQASEAKCPCCGGKYHVANYKRKPAGVPRNLTEYFELRFSFCCSNCRKRYTPPSVRFLPKIRYVALVMVLCSASKKGLSAEIKQLQQELGVPASTLYRWRQWWRERFVKTRLWREKQAAFVPPLDCKRLPNELIDKFSNQSGLKKGLEYLLKWLAETNIT